MSAEHGPQHHESSAERQHEVDAAAVERRAELESSAEKSEGHAEKQAEQVETARKVIDRQDDETPEPVSDGESKPRPSFSTRLSEAVSYRETMVSLQRKLSPVSRSFSQVIHTPVVEKTSEALERTVMRPSVTTGAVTTAVVVGGIFFYFAHTYGYAMHASTLLLSLVAGGFIGLLVEMLARGFHRSSR